MGRHGTSVRKSVMVVLLAVALSGCRDGGSPKLLGQGVDRSAEAAMEVRLYRQDQDLVAQVRLTNTGSSPLNVDRDLVLLLEVHPLSANLQRTGEDSPAAGQPERITALQPGESVEREINLSRGFAHFMGGLMHINYGDYSTWGHYGEEEAWWMAPGAVPTGIEVRYHDPDDGLMGAISEFMDVPYEDLGLYEGPLHVLIQTD